MLILDRGDVRELLSLPECIDAVEEAFRLHALGQLPADPAVLGTHLPGGGFHIKTAALGGTPSYFAAKINANFPDNPRLRGLPTIQGMVALFDATDGRVLALLDSIEITILRTAAASAVAARYLALPHAATVTIVGCGNQGRSHLRAFRHVRPITRAYALDADAEVARTFADSMAAELGITVTATTDLPAAVAASEICATCTPARRPLFGRAMLHPGLFIAAVGADSASKQELDADVLPASRVVVDLLEQAVEMGELQHAVAAGLMTTAGIHADLGQIVAGTRPSRTSPEECFVFDSTGTALQDVAAAALVYARARSQGRGREVPL